MGGISILSVLCMTCAMLIVWQYCENIIVLSFPNLISLPQIDAWPWIMHRRAFLPNDWTMFYLKWEQKAPRLRQGCSGGKPDTSVLCCGWNWSTHAVRWSDGGSRRSTLASLWAAAGCSAQAADLARLHCAHRAWPGGCKETLCRDVSAE